MKQHTSMIVLLLLTGVAQASEPAHRLDYAEILDTFSGHSRALEVKPFMERVKLIELLDRDRKEQGPYRFFGVHERDQQGVDFAELKKKITTMMGVAKARSIQIIGDSGRFSTDGTRKARRFLCGEIDGAGLVEYGFTGYRSDDGSELDINSFVNERADEDPEMAKRVLANIVGHTPVAIQKWGRYGSPNVHHYVVVYNDYSTDQEPAYVDGKKVSGFTTFGNDVTMSDHLLQQADGDRFICLEGGVQSFLQVMNALQQNIPVTLVDGLRKPEKESLFSATRYLRAVSAASERDSDLSREGAQAVFDEYERTLESIWDPNKADFKTKKELFDAAMERFIGGELYKRMASLCTFIDASELPDQEGGSKL